MDAETARSIARDEIAALNPAQRALLLQRLRARRTHHEPIVPVPYDGRLSLSCQPLATAAGGGAVPTTGVATGPRGDGKLVSLSPGREPALFLLHSSGGSVFEYGVLARHLSTGQACWGVEAVGLDGSPPLPDVDSMVRHYVAEIRRTQPAGPYHLVGWSSGGVLAFATAAALRRAGAQVGLLALLDSLPPPQRDRAPQDAELLVAFAHNYARMADGVVLGLAVDELIDLTPDGRRALVLDRLTTAGLTPAGSERLVRARMEVFVSALRTGSTWRPPRYDGPVDLLVAVSGGSSPDDVGARWAPLAATVRTHPVPGDHFSILRPPHAGAVAEVLVDLLRSMESAHGAWMSGGPAAVGA